MDQMCTGVNLITISLIVIKLYKGTQFNLFIYYLFNITPSASLQIPCVSRPVTLENCSPITIEYLTKVVSSMKSSSCPLDVVPTVLFKNVIDTIGPCMLSIINNSLTSGQVPGYFKQAVVQPILKKTNLDPSLPQNFRPISKLPFMAKVLEKVVVNQLSAVLDGHNVFDKFQSGFRSMHSTETALLRVLNDLLMQGDAGECSVLVLLDLTAAFDTVDHCILVERLRQEVGISATALSWLSSY